MPAHKARAIQTAKVLQDARPKPADLSHKPPLRGVACFAPRRGCYCQRLNDAGFLFVQAIVD